MPLRLIPDDTRIPFMKLAKIRTPISLALMALSFVLLFTVGLNQGIDFKGGTVIEVRSTAPAADLADIREKVSALELGDVEVQGIGEPSDVLIRVAHAARRRRRAAGGGRRRCRRRSARPTTTIAASRWSGPRVSGELAWTGTIAIVFTIDRHHGLHLVPLRMAVRHRRHGDADPRRGADRRLLRR